MSASTFPDAVDALYAAAETVAAAADPTTTPGKTVQVIDGPTKHNAQTVIAVAHPHQADGSAMTGQQALSGLSIVNDRESYAIGCYVESWVGAGSYSALRRVCIGLLDGLIATLAADQTLGKVVTRARVAVLDYVPALTSKGPSVVIPFQVQIDAQRRAAA